MGHKRKKGRKSILEIDTRWQFHIVLDQCKSMPMFDLPVYKDRVRLTWVARLLFFWWEREGMPHAP